MSAISEKDTLFVWHPFTHLKLAEKPINIVRSAGTYYYDDEGNKIIDAISSWWVNLHGHCHPHISKKVSVQLFQNEHSIFSGFTHPNAVLLAERLLQHLPRNQSKIFYSDNGSTAVEVALKMVLQYWHNAGIKKNKFIAFTNAYHGDTFGGMSVGARNAFNNAFSSSLFEVIHYPVPKEVELEPYFAAFEKSVAQEEIAGFIFEPLVQGAAGMMMHKEEYLDKLLEICKNHKVITIADEVMTGFGRTGNFFASDQLEHKPDIICLSKGLTGGYMPLGVTSCAEFIYQAYISDDKNKTFFHGHSYTANPTACAAALASLDILEKTETWENISLINNLHELFVNELHKKFPGINYRIRGTILAIEIGTEEGTHYLNPLAEDIAQFFIRRHVLLRPLGNIIYIIPPYCISGSDLEHIYNSIFDFLSQLDHEPKK
ncbi:MAG: adenosylmethionine--8-amino-7-oxononanoate transaminase [Bacteroidia bacterium]